MTAIRITELLGDGIGPELRESVYAVADALPLDFEFIPFDLSLENREKSDRTLYDDLVASMKDTKLSLKYPTVTKTSSPNAIIRRLCSFSVIHRPVMTIKGLDTNFKKPINLHVIRVATGGTYDDPGRMVGRDAAVSIRMVERDPCSQAARYAFELAKKRGLSMTSSSKHTIQRVTDGLFETIVNEVHAEYEDVSHNVELFDAMLAKIIIAPENFQVVLVLNEYGDFLSDMASGLIGSIGLGASGNFSFNEDESVDIAMFDPAGGTAPDIAGQNKCNPAAMLLAFGMLLDHIDHYPLGHELRIAMLDAIAEGTCTGDIGGSLGTREFTQEVIDRFKDKI